MLTLATWVAEFAKSQPNKTAVVDQDGHRQTSYAELNVMAARVARLLLDSGVKRNDLIPVLLPRDVRYAAAVVGVIRVGAVPVPLNPADPQGAHYHQERLPCASHH